MADLSLPQRDAIAVLTAAHAGDTKSMSEILAEADHEHVVQIAVMLATWLLMSWDNPAVIPGGTVPQKLRHLGAAAARYRR